MLVILTFNVKASRHEEVKSFFSYRGRVFNSG